MRKSETRKRRLISTVLQSEYRDYAVAVESGDVEEAWRHLERAHIVAQPMLGEHCRSHWKMLRFAVKLRDWREARGQLFRLALAPFGNLSRRLPTGNTGRANVSAFARMSIPEDLQSLVLRSSN